MSGATHGRACLFHLWPHKAGGLLTESHVRLDSLGRNKGENGMGALAALGILWGLFVTIFWMVCAWRGMRAHQELAAAVEELSRRGT